MIGEVNLEALVTGGIGARSPGGRLVQRGRMIPLIASIKEVNERDQEEEEQVSMGGHQR